MFEQLEIMRMARGLAAHAENRQTLVAQNVANADTPGYRARDLPTFAETYGTGFQVPMRATRPGHVQAAAALHPAAHSVEAGGQAAPNGNTVSLETEMLRAVDIKRGHDRAIAVYGAALDILRSAAGRPR